MTRLELGAGIGASRFVPVDYTYIRQTKDGAMPIITYLFGTHFNEVKDGIITQSASTGWQNGTITTSGGKLVLSGDATTTGVLESISGTHSTFTYFYPKTIYQGNAELAVAQIGESSPGVKFVHRMRTEFEDLGTSDKLTIDLEAGNSVANTNAQFIIRETRGSVTTVLGTYTLPATEKLIDWKIEYLDEGVTKILYKTANGEPTVLFKGDLTAEITECKVIHKYMTDESSPTRSVYTDFIWCRYPALFSGHDTDIIYSALGIVKIFDTNGTETESAWTQVWSKDHFFTGDRVFDNGLLRMRFKGTPEIEIYGWNPTSVAWELTGSIIPQNNSGVRASYLHDLIISSYNRSQAEIIAKFGIVDYNIIFHKGMPYARFLLGSKKFIFKTTKARFAMSANLPDTNLLDYNQKYSDDTNRGNPLNLSTPEVISSFTEGTSTTRGLNHVNDNWFAVYNLTANSVVGFIGSGLIPSTIDIEATSSTVLKEVRYSWRQENILGVGILHGDPTTAVAGVPTVFNPGNDDTYVKWRANACYLKFPQRHFVRKKR